MGWSRTVAMVDRTVVRRVLLGREVAVAYAVLVGLYLVRTIRVQAVQIPAYLLIVAYDVVEVALPVVTPYHPVGFPVFLYLLAVAGAAATRRFTADTGSGWGGLRAAGGGCLVVGLISLAFGAMVGGPVVAPTDNPTPLAITATTGLVFLAVGWWLLRGVPKRSGSPRTADT